MSDSSRTINPLWAGFATLAVAAGVIAFVGSPSESALEMTLVVFLATVLLAGSLERFRQHPYYQAALGVAMAASAGYQLVVATFSVSMSLLLLAGVASIVHGFRHSLASPSSS